MKNNIDNHYLIYNTCMKLKKRGFDVWCNKFYGPYPHHNGEPLGEDEEYELRAEGRGKEITSEIILQTWTSRNSMMFNKKSCSCPDINVVLDWILENWNTHIIVKPYWQENHELSWYCDIYYINKNDNKHDYIQLMNTITKCDSKYHAYAEGIRWTLDNYKTI